MSDTATNGWPVIHSRASKNLKTGTIPGTKIKLTCQKDALPVLLAVAAEFNERVSRLAVNNAAGQDEGGYTYRRIGGTQKWSTHAAGAAIDLDWRKFPMFKDRMTAKQKVACRSIVRDFSPVIAWGGDFGNGRVDQMHFEIRRGITPTFVKTWAAQHIGPDGRLKK